MKRGKVIAHRGVPSLKVENSLEGIEEALRLRVDGIEVDVRLTKDRIPIAFHDADMLRLFKINKLLKEVSLAEIKALSRRRGFTVPTLSEVLNLVGNKSMIVLDVKEWGVVDLMMRILHSSSAKDIVITSFDHRIPLKVKSEAPWVKVGFIVSFRPLSVSKLITDDVNCLFLKKDYADEELVNEAIDLGLEVYIWVINDVVNAERFWRLGVSGIVTDKPQLFVN
ncbi:MAG: glycerophosphodiester phosphodiesterase [Candidatus Nezhaarchaeota archaeon]|nr:glycerophosphodiester phosphodiesterase [Candidatus Nezhaarchaeota archaeon]MCX8142346.1 glycerophosphodiester phosphodiesterase [Candidatus Nezhaarchaeota archaeon]MDW8050681.1 glycerophosphodiester phosphodiesterase [Nitrososphaerota archaeon]